MDTFEGKVFKMRKKAWGQYKKSLLDLLIERYRFLRVEKYIKTNSKLLDLGCGYDAKLLSHFSSKIKYGVGIDIVVAKKLKGKNFVLLKGRADKHIELKSNSFDTITALALIEHIEYPRKMLEETYRLLKRGGSVILTTPSIKSKPLLEFMAFKLGIISKHEIKDHKQYYSKDSLFEVFVRSGFKKRNIKINTFGMGLILFARAIK